MTVNGLDVSDMQEIFETRAVLEGLSARLALPYMTEAAIRQLEDLFDRIDDRDRHAGSAFHHVRRFDQGAEQRVQRPAEGRLVVHTP